MVQELPNAPGSCPAATLPGPGQGELCVPWAGIARSLAPAAGSGAGQNCHFKPLIKLLWGPRLSERFC